MDLTWFNILFVAGMAVLFVYDFYLANTPGKVTISIQVWLAELAHPTLILGVAVAGISVALTFWDDKVVAIFALIGTGHLATSEGAYAALGSAARWKRMALIRNRFESPKLMAMAKAA